MKKSVWQYSLFQIPSILLLVFLILVAIIYLLQPSRTLFWMALTLGALLIALSWALIMPLDLFLRSVLQWPMSLAGRTAILQALFISTFISVISISDLPILWNLSDFSELPWHFRILQSTERRPIVFWGPLPRLGSTFILKIGQAKEMPVKIPTSPPSPTPSPSPTPTPTPDPPPPSPSNCSPAYPDVCIPPPPPDLDCSDISYVNFRVLSPDPHRLDRDRDGIGCETNN